MNHDLLCANPPEIALPRGVALTDTLWENGEVITVSFMKQPSEDIKREVWACALTALRYVNLKFVLTPDDNSQADIRIGFEPNIGSWSYVGNIARLVQHPQNTMNFSWLDDSMDRNHPILTAVVLHEFLHMLGLMHEQNHPLGDIPWDEDAMRAYFVDELGWTWGEVLQTYINKLDVESTTFNEFDEQSVMVYPVSNRFTIGDYEIPWRTQLSNGDKELIRDLYPCSDATDIYLPYIGSF